METALLQHDPAEAEGRVLAKAAFRAAAALGLKQAELARIIGVSEATASRMRDGGFALAGKPFELAACLIRVYRSLDAITGGDAASMRGWMAAANRDLGAIPRVLIGEVTGLVAVLDYLDARRAPL